VIGFSLTEEQWRLRAHAHEFAASEIRPRALEHDRDGTWPGHVVERMWEAGLLNPSLPAGYGGAGQETSTWRLWPRTIRQARGALPMSGASGVSAGAVEGGRVWLITGAASGFGRAIAEAAIESGDAVVSTARAGEALADLVARDPSRAVALELDVTDGAQIPGVVEDAVRYRGRVDVLVNNAGRGHIGALEETDERESCAS
jgi:hypothetical protein